MSHLLAQDDLGGEIHNATFFENTNNQDFCWVRERGPPHSYTCNVGREGI